MRPQVFALAAGTTQVNPDVWKLFVAKYDWDGSFVNAAYWPVPPPGRPASRSLERMHFLDGEDNATVAIAGRTPGVYGSVDSVVVSYDAQNLAQKWERTFSHDPCDDTYYSIEIPTDVRAHLKFVAVTGVTMSSCGNSPSDWFTVVYDGFDGTPIFEKILTGPGAMDDTPVAVRFLNNEQGVVVAGTISTASGRIPIAIAYSLVSEPPGEILWQSATYTEAGRNVDAKAMEMHPNGTSFYVTCVSTPFTPGGTNADVVTIKYNASNGQFGWTPTAEARFNGSFNGDDEPADIDTCNWVGAGPAQTHVWIGGYTTQSTTGKDMLALCYRDLGTTFSQLVSVARDGFGADEDRATSIDAVNGGLIDGSRAYLTGWRTLGGATDFMTGKCRSGLPSDMTPGWPFFYSPALTNEAAGVAAVDEGHCFVVGRAIETPGADQCRTIRYDDGTP